MTNRLLSAWLLILAPLALVVGFSSLGLKFDYPTIMREPIGEVLTRFRAGGPILIAQWFGTLLGVGFLVSVLEQLGGDLAPLAPQPGRLKGDRYV